MIFWLLKKLLFWGLLLGIAVYALVNMKTLNLNMKSVSGADDKEMKLCTVDGKTSMCAAATLKEGQSLGLVARIRPEDGDEPVFLQSSKMMQKTDKETDANIELKPLYIDSKKVDLYGYVKNDIKEGDELKFAPF
jgi:hypothetical protein